MCVQGVQQNTVFRPANVLSGQDGEYTDTFSNTKLCFVMLYWFSKALLLFTQQKVLHLVLYATLKPLNMFLTVLKGHFYQI